MSFTDIYRISSSAMTAQTVRLNTVASNLANAETPSATAADTYQSLHPLFAAVYQNENLLNKQNLSAAHVQVLDVIANDSTVKRYQPSHPLADKSGYVYYPDINIVDEMADMMSASRAFETNVDVLNNVKSMQQSLLRLGE